jgi:hypothetical protein
MTRNDLQDAKDADPFRPFTLVTARRSYRVDHPDYLLFPPMPSPGSTRGWPDYVEAFIKDIRYRRARARASRQGS